MVLLRHATLCAAQWRSCALSLCSLCLTGGEEAVFNGMQVVLGLQAILAACERELIHIDLCINVSKSKCIRFGPRYDVPCADLVSTFGDNIKWIEFDCCRYLGVFLLVAEHSNVTLVMLNHISLKHLMLYMATLASDEVVLSSPCSKCLPVLLYATEACQLLPHNIQ